VDGRRSVERRDHNQIAGAQRALGRALRELRIRAGLTQKELGARAGANDTYLSQIETGQRDIRWSTVTCLLRALGATTAELAAHHYRHKPAVGLGLAARQAGQDPRVVQIAWRAQRRLHQRWIHLGQRRGKPTGTVAIACARELASFCWEAATLD
jgi:transcriptional regulator with XRE-family HTH domain